MTPGTTPAATVNAIREGYYSDTWEVIKVAPDAIRVISQQPGQKTAPLVSTTSSSQTIVSGQFMNGQ
jgi:hypothetical protein